MRALSCVLLLSLIVTDVAQGQALLRRLGQATGTAVPEPAPAPSAPPAPDLNARIGAADDRWNEYREGLQSSDPVARSEALRAALADDNIGIRNNALWLALRGRSTLAIDFVPEPGSRIPLEDMPTIEVDSIRWSDQRTFSDGARLRFSGELIEGKLRVHYRALSLISAFGAREDSVPAGRFRVNRNCTLLLEISPGEPALTGPFRCEGLARTFKARLPLE